MKKVIILVGASGSGKTTWARNYITEVGTDSAVVSADHFFIQSDGSYQFDGSRLPEAHSICLRTFREALIRGCPLVLVDNTSTRQWERQEYITLAKHWGYEVWLNVFKIDPTVAAGRNIHGVPLDSVQKMNDRIDVVEGFYEV